MSSGWRSQSAPRHGIKLLDNEFNIRAIHMVSIILNTMFCFIRNYVSRFMLKRLEQGVYFYRSVYSKFPSLLGVESIVHTNGDIGLYPNLINHHEIIPGDHVSKAPGMRFYNGEYTADDLPFRVIILL